jgi:hypothetical protein
MDDKTYIKTMGSAKAYIQRGTQRDAKEVSWDVDYNGDNADIDLDIGSNGEMTHYKAILSNEDLANLLNIPSVNQPLENRLQNDFLVDRRVYKLEPVSYQKPMPMRVIRTRKYKRRPKTTRSSRSKATSSNRRKPTSRPKTMRIRLNRRRSSSSSRRRSN